MKIAARVFIYIGYALSIFYTLFMLIFAVNFRPAVQILVDNGEIIIDEESLLMLSTMIWVALVIVIIYTVATFIVGIKTDKHLKNGFTGDGQIILYGVLSLIFVNILAGLFVLLLLAVKEDGNSREELNKRLNELKDMLDRGLINEEEYSELKKRTIEKNI